MLTIVFVTPKWIWSWRSTACSRWFAYSFIFVFLLLPVRFGVLVFGYHIRVCLFIYIYVTGKLFIRWLIQYHFSFTDAWGTNLWVKIEYWIWLIDRRSTDHGILSTEYNIFRYLDEPWHFPLFHGHGVHICDSWIHIPIRQHTIMDVPKVCDEKLRCQSGIGVEPLLFSIVSVGVDADFGHRSIWLGNDIFYQSKNLRVHGKQSVEPHRDLWWLTIE